MVEPDPSHIPTPSSTSLPKDDGSPGTIPRSTAFIPGDERLPPRSGSSVVHESGTASERVPLSSFLGVCAPVDLRDFVAMSSHQPQAAPESTLIHPTEAEYAYWVNTRVGWFHRIIRIFTAWYWSFAYRLRSYGQHNVPNEGAFLMVPNHSSYTDPFVQVKGQHRVVRFMAKASLFGNPIAGAVIRAGGGFPVRRGSGDTFAMDLARRMLQDGQPVVLYPEGTRFRKSVPLGPPRRGAARLVLELGVPVLPVATWGNKQHQVYGRSKWRRPRVTTVFGPVMHFDTSAGSAEEVDRVRDEIWAEVQRLYVVAREIGEQHPRPRTARID